MTPALEKITFEAFGLTWSLDGSHVVKLESEETLHSKNAIKLLQHYVDESAGQHVPTIEIVETFDEIDNVKLAIVKREESPEPAEDA